MTEPETFAPADHSLECRKWYLAFSAAKAMLEKAQRGCPCCQAKRQPRKLTEGPLFREEYHQEES